MYLGKEGKLAAMPTDSALFNIELHKGCVAFRVLLSFLI
jgi:hypothetical protein